MGTAPVPLAPGAWPISRAAARTAPKHRGQCRVVRGGRTVSSLRCGAAGGRGEGAASEKGPAPDGPTDSRSLAPAHHGERA